MKLSRTALFAGLAGALALSGCDQTSPDIAAVDDDPFAGLEVGDVIPGRYVVVLDDAKLGGQTSRAAVARLAVDLGADDDALIYSNTITGFAADLSSKEAEALRSDERVKFIEPDQVFGLAPPPGKGPGSGGGGGDAEQVTPYGTSRVNGGVSGAGLVACVIDSGVDLDHADLNVDASRSRTFMSGKDGRSADDGNGHGSHVAGTIAAKDNGIGSIGVAPGATIVAVKVLDSRGSGSTSGVIAGVDYVGSGAAGCTVANMSLGGGVSQALDQAVLDAGQRVTMVLAAGNETDDANNHSPARAGGASSNDQVFSISAFDENDRLASFSNVGSAVEYSAPGVRVFSTYKDGGYATLSGTSMAAPHAAGVMLLGNFTTDGVISGDRDGDPDPIIVH